MSSNDSIQRKNSSVLFLAHSFVKAKDDIANIFLFILAKQINKMGYQVSVLAPHSSNLKTYEKIKGVSIYRFRYMWEKYERLAYRGNMDELIEKSLVNKLIFIFFLFSFWVRSLMLVRRLKIRLVHAHWLLPGGFIGYLVSVLSGKPLLVTIHGTDLRILKDSKLARVLAKIIIKKASHISVVSSFLKQRIVGYLNVQEDKVSVISMPVDTEKIKILPQFDKIERKVILCVARHTKQKRIAVFLEALSILKSRGVDFEACLVGWGPEQRRLKEKTNTLNLSEQVKFLGSLTQEKLNVRYNQSDLVVLPSVEEGFGLVLAEALLCKKPVIGADSGGIPDIIQDGITGILVPPDDAGALADAIYEVLTDESLANKLASSGQRFVQENLTPEIIAKKFINIYNRTLDEQEEKPKAG